MAPEDPVPRTVTWAFGIGDGGVA